MISCAYGPFRELTIDAMCEWFLTPLQNVIARWRVEHRTPEPDDLVLNDLPPDNLGPDDLSRKT